MHRPIIPQVMGVVVYFCRNLNVILRAKIAIFWKQPTLQITYIASKKTLPYVQITIEEQKVSFKFLTGSPQSVEIINSHPKAIIFNMQSQIKTGHPKNGWLAKNQVLYRVSPKKYSSLISHNMKSISAIAIKQIYLYSV